MASAFATLNPTRNALNPPGPFATNIASTWLILTVASSIRRRSAGTSSTEWFRPERQVSSVATSPPLEKATEAYLVDVSIESSMAAPPPLKGRGGRRFLVSPETTANSG
jgi:hypothetical protein